MNFPWSVKPMSSPVTPDRPLNGLRPSMVIMDEVLESGSDMERRAALLRESFALTNRILHHGTRIRMERVREQCVRKILRQYRIEQAYSTAFIYARLKPHGA